jgi:hypothetical protein
MEVMAAAYERARREVIRAVRRGLDGYDFSRAVTRIVRRAIPFEGTCLLTFDPSTRLPTGEAVEYGLPSAAMARLSEIELRERDFNKFTVLAPGRQRAASLSGSCGLGALTLLREARRPHFTPTEVRFAASLAGPLAEGFRRAAHLADARDDDDNHNDDRDTGHHRK